MGEETRPLRRNTSLDFVGIARLKAEQKRQLADFERWAAQKSWARIHHSHYDWWMFPIPAPSSDGLKWTVYAGDIAELKADEAYQRDYLRGVELLMASWGWDLGAQDFLPDPHPDQRWQDWPVRLYKAAVSLQAFGFDAHFASVKKYALLLIERGVGMEWNRRNLAVFFTEGKDPYKQTRGAISTAWAAGPGWVGSDLMH